MDGWIENERVALEFQGCWYHAHDCVKRTEKNCALLDKRKEHRKEKLQFLTSKGIKVVEMWECDWKAEKKENKQNPKRTKFYSQHRNVKSQ